MKLKRNRYVVLVFILGCFNSYVQAQKEITIGTKHLINSEILDEERSFWVYLPETYNDTVYTPEKYPVMYFLDGDRHFHSLTGVQEFMSYGPYASFPDMIMVGILNTDRPRDLTPTHYVEPEKGKKHNFPSSGGGPQFMKFLSEELIPEIETKYRSNGYRIFAGHSFGGLTVLNTILTQKELFNAYIAMDPSVWWDNSFLLKKAREELGKQDFTGKVLYLTMANKKAISEDTTTDHPRAIEAFKTELEKHNNNGLLWNYSFFEDEDHGTIPLISAYYGLRFIYKGFQAEVKSVANHPEELEIGYEKLSERLHYEIQPSEWLVDWIANYCKRTNRLENAEKLYRLNAHLYP